MLKIGYLGPEGTFTQQAALHYLHNKQEADLNAMPNIRDTLLAVQRGDLDLAVIPFENSIEGSVNIVLDVLAWEVNLKIIDELILRISQTLMVTPGAKWQDITEVYTHPQSAGQCRLFLDTHLPQAKLYLTSSNAEGARQAQRAGRTAGAIGPEAAADKFGLQVVLRDIQDNDNNFTRFVVAGNETSRLPAARNRTSIVFSTEHKPGSLACILDIFNLWDINMTKIESRPSRGQLGRYIFFIDIDGHMSDPDVRDALTMIQRKTNFYKFLGSYPMAEID
ncbi:prephenate dehydratase [Desulfosporosinus acidiphilus SJ4]|uniref:Prephenate dehydratase n=1 Tax=Desulfosporosinus acidiphilus (strain DSM 22704 / JCM 16185 / SJ4) TaxID=646529 RepID=I4D2Z9_DESAJ|nr:prephenate dehydratase [Desulfosporosinus acidiphilus]AFM40173.1 prephenate dehydratase [Desulfosporosinus acidiphilus SJ4]